MADDSGVSVSHFGICVTDLEVTQRFFTEALGFAYSHEVDFSEPFDKLTEIPGLDGHAVFMLNGPQMIELIEYRAPGIVGEASRRPMNKLGITHMAFVVADIAAVADRIDALGGKALRDTLVESPAGSMMFAIDPNGVRLELWEKSEAM